MLLRYRTIVFDRHQYNAGFCSFDIYRAMRYVTATAALKWEVSCLLPESEIL